MKQLLDEETGEVVEVDESAIKPPVGRRPFVDTLRILEAGQLMQSLTDLQHDIVCSLQEHGGKGELAIKLLYVEGPHSQISVSAKVTAKPAAERRGSTLFYADQGNLTRDNPNQDDLFNKPKEH